MIRVKYSNVLYIDGLTEKQLEQVKDELTIVNPKYLSAMKYSNNINYISINKYIFYYEILGQTLIAPQGYILPFKYTVVKDTTCEKTVFNFPKFNLKLRDIQIEAYNSYIQDTNKGIISLPTGSGKEHPLTTLILTPEGFIKMGDIKIGQKVISEEGKPCNVIGVFPQGRKDVYRVTFKDNTSVKCGKEHLWKIRTYNMRKNNTPYKIMTLSEILKLPLKYEGAYNLRIPLTKPIVFKENFSGLPIHPYVLGALLGDGCTCRVNHVKQNVVYFSNPEKDVVDKVNSLIKEFGYFSKNHSTLCQYRFTRFDKRDSIKNSEFLNYIRDLKLDVKSGSKFIPEIYKYSTIEDRKLLLQGLFDTDGYVAINGAFSISSSGEILVNDILWLCRSLGYRPNLRVQDRRGNIKKVGVKEYVTKSIEYSVSIPTHDLIFTSKKHIEKNKLAVNNHPNNNIHRYDDLSIVSIEYSGVEECQCIAVDSECHTYLCGDFIVTHNTVLGMYIASRLKQRTLIIVHKDDLLTGWQKDIEKTFNGVIKTGIIKAQKYTIEKYFTIATIQTLSRMSMDVLEDTLSYFGLIIVDECSHIPASTFSLINYFSGAYRIGLSATVERNDGMEKLFNLYLGGFGYKFDKSKSTKDVLPAKVCIATVPIVYIPTVIKNSKGKYIECEEDTPHCIPIDKIAHKLKPHVHFMELENHVIRNPIFANKICTDIVHEYRKGRSIVIFFNQKAHCLEYYEGLIQYYNIPEKDIQIYYGDSEESNDVLLGRAESKEVKITLTTYKKANEGTNVKAWEVCFLASSINNGMGVQQTTGRIRRSNSNKINPVLVYDYSLPNVYTIGKHIYTRIRRYMELKYKVINR